MVTTNILISNSPAASPLLEINEPETGLRAAFIERENIYEIPTEWTENSCGFYLLLSRIKDDNTYEAYAGKVMKGFARMLKEHAETKEYWKTAILFKSDNNSGFSINQAAYLEGKIREILSSNEEVEVKNIIPPWDHTLFSMELPLMKSAIDFSLRILSLRGYSKPSMEAEANKVVESINESLNAAESILELDSFMPVTPSVQTAVQRETNVTALTPFKVNKTPIPQPASTTETMVALKAWRTAQAKLESVPAYVIASNRTLEDIALNKPVNLKDLLKVPGIGKLKSERYGEEIIKIVVASSRIAA